VLAPRRSADTLHSRPSHVVAGTSPCSLHDRDSHRFLYWWFYVSTVIPLSAILFPFIYLLLVLCCYWVYFLCYFFCNLVSEWVFQWHISTCRPCVIVAQCVLWLKCEFRVLCFAMCCREVWLLSSSSCCITFSSSSNRLSLQFNRLHHRSATPAIFVHSVDILPLKLHQLLACIHQLDQWSENAARNQLAPACAQRRSQKVNQATLSLSHSPVKAPVPVRTHCTNTWWNRRKTDFNSFPRRKLKETTGTSSYYMDENHSAVSEIQRSQYGRRSWLGSKPSTLEIDVYVLRYALLVVLARNDDDDTLTIY